MKSLNPSDVEPIRPYYDHIPKYYSTVKIKNKSVLKALENEMYEFIPSNPILIDAQTGVGKTTFIMKNCIPEALKNNKNVLILINRSAVGTQIKKSVLKAINSPKDGNYTEKGLREKENFGNVRVVSYQRLPSFLKEEGVAEWCNNLMFVVCDEIHFVVADALFNVLTTYILNLITSKFCHSIRIYMTATSDDVLYPLAEAEKNNNLKVVGYQEFDQMFIRYYFKRDFKPYILDFFEELEQIPELIKKTDDEKWIIFVDKKSDAEYLKNCLNGACDYVDADCKDTTTWEQIVLEERFESKVLITTSVLDNGVNIKDDAVKNIVIMSDSKTDFLQMLGRKRLKKNEVVKIWAYDMNLTQARNRLKNYRELLNWFHLFETYYTNKRLDKFINILWHEKDVRLCSLFELTGNTIYPNWNAHWYLLRKTHFLSRIVEKKTTFREEVATWLDKFLDEDSGEEILEDFCQKHCNCCLSEEDCSTLRELIIKTCEEQGYTEAQPSRRKSLGYNALNNRLERLNLDFRIEKSTKNWILKNIHEST